MGHRQDMTDKQCGVWDQMQYNARKEANKGHNYQYWTEGLEYKLEAKGYKWYKFDTPSFSEFEATSSEQIAIDKVKELRENGYYARIVCGMIPMAQRIKMYSITYKPRA